MKQLLVFLAVGCLAVGVYKIHNDRVKAAAEIAAIEARSKAVAEAQAKAAKEAKARRDAEAAQRSKVLLEAVGLSRVIEPLYTELFSDLNQSQPADLVPPLEVTRERILDKKTHVEAEKQPAYDAAIRLLTAMAAVGEERTKTLQAMLQAAQAKASLEGTNSMTRSGAFFAQGVVKRWDEERKRRKPALDQIFAQLRNAEREWNKRAGEHALVENYDLPALAPLYITTEQVAASNPLDRRAYDQRRVIYPWRTIYYDRYGYPRTIYR
jgi:hypothetical protein